MDPQVWYFWNDMAPTTTRDDCGHGKEASVGLLKCLLERLPCSISELTEVEQGQHLSTVILQLSCNANA